MKCFKLCRSGHFIPHGVPTAHGLRLIRPYLVGGLWAERNEVPKHVRILQMGLWVPLLGVDEVGKLQENGNGSGDTERSQLLPSSV